MNGRAVSKQKHMARVCGAVVWAAALFAFAGCGGATPEPNPAAERPLQSSGPSPQSSEWLYVTRQTRGGRDAECRAVLAALRGERECKYALCGYALRLGEDFRTVCAKEMPEATADVEALLEQLQKRHSEAHEPCEKEVMQVIRHGCPASADCGEYAQQWASRCGSSFASPLVLRMLSVQVERATGGPVTIDPRSCDEVASELAEGLGCRNLPSCTDQLEALEQYRKRCTEPDRPRALEGAILELAVLAAAGETSEALPVARAELSGPVPVIPLADKRGAIVSVGWSRPKTQAEYEKALAALDGEPIHVARVFEDQKSGEAQLYLGVFYVEQGESLGERFALLRTAGEAQGEDRELEGAVKSALDAAVAADDPRKGLSALIRGLSVTSAELGRVSGPLRELLSSRDAALKRVFKSLGEEKSRKFSQIRLRTTLLPTLRRAKRLALTDVADDGSVVVGGATDAALVDLRQVLPKSFSAYEEGLTYIVRSVEHVQLRTDQEKELFVDAQRKLSGCAEMQEGAREAERELLRCSFGIERCDEDRIDSLDENLEGARERAAEAARTAKLAVELLREDFRRKLPEDEEKACMGQP